MTFFTIKASVMVDVEIDVQAASKEAAAELFRNHICMTASLLDLAAEDFDVSEDSIADVEVKSIDAA
jgi:hypothetical protein